jgi:Amt family ammonium transporter
MQPAAVLSADHGYGLVKFFFLLTFAAAIPAIISGGIAERARFVPQLCATALIVAFIYPFFEGMVWNGNFGLQAWLTARFGAAFHDFAGSVVVHAMGGWLALAAVCCSVRATAVIAKGAWWRSRRRAFRFWRWVRGS